MNGKEPLKTMRKKWKWAALGLCAALLLGGCAKETAEAPELLEPAGVELDFAVAQRMDLGTVRQWDYSVVPYTEDLFFTLDGTIEGVYTHLGADVKKGDVLLTLDESALLEEEERLAGEIAYQAQLDAYDDRIAQIDIELGRLALADLRASGADDAAIVKAQGDVEMQELLLRQAREERSVAAAGKQAQLDAVRAKIGKNQLVAPFDGTVVSFAGLREGYSVQAWDELITLADPSRLSLSGPYLTEGTVTTAAKIWARIGATDYPVEYVPSDMGEYLTVVFAGGTPKSRFSFAVEPEGVSCGDFAALCMLTGVREGVLAIPINALYSDDAGRYVYRLEEDGSRVRVPVRTGINNGLYMQITEGLEEGDRVYVKE